jgi:nicotinamide-nucleotide amidase
VNAPTVRAAVVVTGDEVLGGRVLEKNAAFIARQLAERGVTLERTVIVSDTRATIARTITELIADGIRLLCVTGGLGPTYDDLTMQAVADATGRDLALDPAALEMVRERSRGVRRQMHITESELEAMRRKQATLPAGADVLTPVGTAPGCVLVHGLCVIVVMTALNTLPQDALARIGTYTRSGELEIVSPAELADEVTAVLEAHFPGSVFAHDGEQVEAMVASLLGANAERLAVAESCTGGGLGARLTSLPGASSWFDGGVIAYSNAVKESLLGVSSAILERYGAVSIECAAAMADGVRVATGAQWGVSITGVAGPGGGTDDKPVGTVCIGIAGPTTTATGTRFWGRDRESIRLRAQTAALHHLRWALQHR